MTRTNVNGCTPKGEDSRSSRKTGQAEQAFVDLLTEACHPGFFGSASLSFTIQDGRIQHVRVSTERVLK